MIRKLLLSASLAVCLLTSAAIAMSDLKPCEEDRVLGGPLTLRSIVAIKTNLPKTSKQVLLLFLALALVLLLRLILDRAFRKR